MGSNVVDDCVVVGICGFFGFLFVGLSDLNFVEMRALLVL